MSYTYLLYLLVFLPGTLLVYALAPRRVRGAVLLLASYGFYFLASRKLIVYLLLATLVTYGTGRWLEACQRRSDERVRAGADRRAERAANTRCRRAVLWLGVALLGGGLLFLKFGGVLFGRLNLWLPQLSLPTLQLALPLGVSFFTLEAVAYLADVYYQKLPAEHNLGRMALFLAFFPKIMEGPICRYGQVAQELWAGSQLKYQNLTFGAQRLLWGLFKKLIVADRLSVLVGNLFDQYANYRGGVVALGAALYTFQLYADFSGCIDMTIGTGELFGVRLPENFRQPFFARTPSEFWRRWHITLGAWFKDYIFYPISLTRGIKTLGKKARKKLGKHYGQVFQTLIPLFAVWLCNGAWHGTGWTFLFYGMYYFVLIVLGELAEPLVASAAGRLGIDRKGVPWRVLQGAKMLAIIFTGELFFRAPSMQVGVAMFTSIFTGLGRGGLTQGALLTLGLSWMDFVPVILGLLAMLAVGVLHERGVHIRERVASWKLGWRWGFYYLALFAVLVFGVYGLGHTPAELIYASF